jgi:hypothetical protein
VQQPESGFRLRVARIGVFNDIDYSRVTGEASIQSTRALFAGALNQMHHVAGLWHETAYFRLLGWVVAIVSVILVVVGISGIYLWFKIHTERVTGAILLGR